MKKKTNLIKVFVIDDEQAATIKNELQLDERIQIVGTSINMNGVIQKLKEKLVDVIVLDIDLADKINGIEGARLIQEAMHTKTPKIIFHSVWSNKKEIQDEARKMGHMLVGKDISIKELANIIKQLADGQPIKIEKEKIDLLSLLSNKEKKVLNLVYQGHTNEEIAIILGRKIDYIVGTLNNLLLKLQCKNTSELKLLTEKYQIIGY